MKKTIHVAVCDLCNTETDCKEVTYPVWFNTDQTEGRNCPPYISNQKLDLCDECMKKVIKISGYGAQGYNNYKLVDLTQ